MLKPRVPVLPEDGLARHTVLTSAQKRTPRQYRALRGKKGRCTRRRALYDYEAYAKLGDELYDHVADLRGRQILITLSRGFA
jgi:DNA-binding GntR family transcriptional regulator